MGWFVTGLVVAHPPEGAGAAFMSTRWVASTECLELAHEAFDAGDFRSGGNASRPCSVRRQQSTLRPRTYAWSSWPTECATWRNFFDRGRRAAQQEPGQLGSAPTFRPAPDRLLTSWRSASMARAWDLDLAIDFASPKPDVNYRLTLRNGVLIRLLPADCGGSRLRR